MDFLKICSTLLVCHINSHTWRTDAMRRQKMWLTFKSSAWWLNISPVVCWENIGEARNLRNPQWNTSSSLVLIGSVLLGCLCTKRCITDICSKRETIHSESRKQHAAQSATPTDMIPSARAAAETPAPGACQTGRSPWRRKERRWCAAWRTSRPGGKDMRSERKVQTNICF